METFFPYLLSLVLVPLSFYLISFIFKNGSNNTRNHPPGSKGWPFLGESIEFALLGPQKFINQRMEKYSDEVFRSSLFGENMVAFCGPQGNKFLFMNENKLVNFWLPQSLKNAFGFPEYIEKSVMEIGAPYRSFRHNVFKQEALKEYISVMDTLTRKHLDNYWSTSNKVVKVFPMTRKYTFEVACRLFLNVVDPEQIKKLFDPFSLINEGMLSIPIEFPGTAYSRGIKGGKTAREELMRIIKERREELISMQEKKEIMISSTDVLTKMLLEGSKDFSDMEICFDIISLLLASYETTSSATTAVINDLAQLPHIYEEVFKEQMEIAKSKGPDELLTWKDIEKMKYSWNVVRESLRLTPPGLGGFREATTEFTYAGFTIPRGWKTIWSVYSSHMNPKYFPEPEKFEPSRFEGNGPSPYTFVPFGGGPWMCPGKEYARLQILIFIHNVVTRFKLEKEIPNEKFDVVRTLPRPEYGLPVHLHPHEK